MKQKKEKGLAEELIEEDFEEDEEEKTEQEDSPKDTKKLMIAIGIIAGLFIVFFAAGYLMKSVFNPTGAVTLEDLHEKNLRGEETDKNYVYNGYSFVFADGLWYTRVKREDGALVDIPLHFGPKQLENVTFAGKLDERFNQNEVYVAFNPLDEHMQYVALAASELTLNMAVGIKAVPIGACVINETEACETRPIVDCSNKDNAVIVLQQSEGDTTINMKGNCVELRGKDWELVKAVDRLLLLWYKVMEKPKQERVITTPVPIG